MDSRFPSAVESPYHENNTVSILTTRTLEGMRRRRYPLVSVQYHPEASADPHDNGYLFEEFRQMVG
jgi:carbamoyl-phosphate synthase small subunit